MTPKKQILIVEDSWLNREMLIEILADQYVVLQAENGQEALEILEQHKNDIALILLDVMMPVMDGFPSLVSWISPQCRNGPEHPVPYQRQEAAHDRCFRHDLPDTLLGKHQIM